MESILQKRCELFVQNRNEIKDSFEWDNVYMYPLCASIYTSNNMNVDVSRMKECKALLKKETGVFSNFRGSIQLAFITILSMEQNPQQRLHNTLQVYEKLKKEFFNSSYLPLPSLMITGMADIEKYDEIVKRTKEIYNMMKKEHLFLTSSEDSSLASLLALSDKSNEQLISEMEKCYDILKSEFYSGNALQSLSHVLALGDGYAEGKCSRMIELFKALKEKGYKYSMGYELPTLGVMSLLEANVEQLVADIIQVEEYLKGQKGFGTFGIGKKQRLMYASILAANEYMHDENKQALQTTMIGETLSIVIAEQVAICSAMAASLAVSSSITSN